MKTEKPMTNDKPKIYCETPPTQEFEDAFSSRCSGCRRQCACGRVCFDTYNSYDWERGELEELLRLADEQPDNYFPLPYAVSTMTIDGCEWVMGCRCNGARKYQNFIDRHDAQIADYLRKKQAALTAQAKELQLDETKQP